MMSLRAASLGFLASCVWIQAHAQSAATVTMPIGIFPPLISAPSCAPDTTSCGDFGKGTATVTIGDTYTVTSLETSTVIANFTRTLFEIIPSVTTVVGSGQGGFCKIVTTTTVTEPITSVKTEYTTTTKNQFIDTVITSVKVYTETVDSPADCIISVPDATFTAAGSTGVANVDTDQQPLVGVAA